MIGIVNVHKSDHFFLFRMHKVKYKLCRKSTGYAEFRFEEIFLIRYRYMKQARKKTCRVAIMNEKKGGKRDVSN